MMTNTRRLITLHRLGFKNPLASACSAAIIRAGRISASVVNRPSHGSSQDCSRNSVSYLAGFRGKRSARAGDLFLNLASGVRDLFVRILFGGFDQFPALLERGGSLLFGSSVTFGARLANRRFVLGELGLVTAPRGPRFIGRPFGPGLSLVEHSTNGPEQNPVQHENENDEEN